MATKQRSTVPELGDNDNNELVSAEPATDGLQRVYLGPTLNKPYLKHGTVFIGELPSYITDNHKKLIVPLDKMVEFEKKLSDRDSIESIYYKGLKDGV